MCQGMGNQEWIAADLDNLGVVEVGRTFFDDGLNKSRIDILIQLEGVIIVPSFNHCASSEPSVISSRISIGIFSAPVSPIWTSQSQNSGTR